MEDYTLGIPYWDWRIDADSPNPFNSAIWDMDTFG